MRVFTDPGDAMTETRRELREMAVQLPTFREISPYGFKIKGWGYRREGAYSAAMLMCNGHEGDAVTILDRAEELHKSNSFERVLLPDNIAAMETPRGFGYAPYVLYKRRDKLNALFANQSGCGEDAPFVASVLLTMMDISEIAGLLKLGVGTVTFFYGSMYAANVDDA